MSIQNYIFQAQNAVFQTLKSAQIGVETVMNRGQNVVYPHIMIASTKKINLINGQIQLESEVMVVTKDFSPISASNILEKIENSIDISVMQNFMNFYTLNSVSFGNSSVFANEEGFFCGTLTVHMVVD